MQCFHSNHVSKHHIASTHQLTLLVVSTFHSTHIQLATTHSDPDCFHQKDFVSVQPELTYGHWGKDKFAYHVLNLVFATNLLKFVQRNVLMDCFVREHHVASPLN